MTDLTTLPEGLEPPIDDGAAAHLVGRRFPSVSLSSTAGGSVDLSEARGLAVVYVYPMTGAPAFRYRAAGTRSRARAAARRRPAPSGIIGAS